MNQVTTIAAALTGSRNVGLSFMARSVIIDNPTSAWVFVPEAAQFVPPLTMAMVIQYRYATQNPGIVFQTPTGVPQSLTIPQGTVAFNFTDEQLAPQSGTAIPAVNISTNPYVVNTDVIFNIAAGGFTLDLSSLLVGAQDNDGLFIIVSQFNNAAPIPTVATPAGWFAAGGANGTTAAVAMRVQGFERVWHPGITNVVLTFTNTTNSIVTMLRVRNQRRPLMFGNSSGVSAVVAASQLNVQGAFFNTGVPGALNIYSGTVNGALRINAFALSGGAVGQVVTPIVNDFTDVVSMDTSVFTTPIDVLGTAPLLVIGTVSNYAIAMGLTASLLHI